jgi:hypothetical protein
MARLVLADGTDASPDAGEGAAVVCTHQWLARGTAVAGTRGRSQHGVATPGFRRPATRRRRIRRATDDHSPVPATRSRYKELSEDRGYESFALKSSATAAVPTERGAAA